MKSLDYTERAVACFKALASGDAIGKQTETLSRAGVLRWYPDGISGFHGAQGTLSHATRATADMNGGLERPPMTLNKPWR